MRNNVSEHCCSNVKYFCNVILDMQKHAPQSLKLKLISLILVSTFTLSSLGYGPISVWAQESSNYPAQGGIQNANPPQNGMNPCLGLHGNYTGMHHFGQGNYTRNGMHPCSGQTPSQAGNGNNTLPQGIVTSSTSGTPTPPIPSWVKNNAKWWSGGTIDDSTFAQGIQYMIQQGIVKIPTTQSGQASAGVKIPQWVRNDAAYWSSNQIDDSTFVGAIQYLVQSGVISP